MTHEIMPGECNPEGYDITFGLRSVGTGWRNLVHVAFMCLPPGTKITQVKEKFGKLRIYAHGGTDAYYEILGQLEKLSGATCERCGALGHLRAGSYIRTLCDNCHKAEA